MSGFGKPRPDAFPGILFASPISKTMTPGDLENDVVTPKFNQVDAILQ